MFYSLVRGCSMRENPSDALIAAYTHISSIFIVVSLWYESIFIPNSRRIFIRLYRSQGLMVIDRRHCHHSVNGVHCRIRTTLRCQLVVDDICKILTGCCDILYTTRLNSITQGIVGSAGMTSQVSTNEMMNHLGTAIIVLTGSVVGVILYPDLGFLFIVSPIACFGFLLFLNRINLSDIDHAEARGLTSTNKKTDQNDPPTTNNETYSPPVESSNKKVHDQPSFNFGWKNGDSTVAPSSGEPKAESPLRVLRDPILLTLYVHTCI